MVPRASLPAQTVAPRGGLALGRLASNIDLRADRRFTVDIGGVLQVKGTPKDIYLVTVRDVSKSGLRVSCPICVPEGSRVELTCCDTIISGEVRYAREESLDEYCLGIRADSTTSGGLDLTLFLEPITRWI